MEKRHLTSSSPPGTALKLRPGKKTLLLIAAAVVLFVVILIVVLSRGAEEAEVPAPAETTAPEAKALLLS